MMSFKAEEIAFNMNERRKNLSFIYCDFSAETLVFCEMLNTTQFKRYLLLSITQIPK